MDPTALVATLGAAGTVLGSAVTGVVTHRAHRRRHDADAAATLAGTVAQLGEQINGLYVRLSAAEVRASAAEARAAVGEAEVARLRVEVGALQARLAEHDRNEQRLLAEKEG